MMAAMDESLGITDPDAIAMYPARKTSETGDTHAHGSNPDPLWTGRSHNDTNTTNSPSERRHILNDEEEKPGSTILGFLSGRRMATLILMTIAAFLASVAVSMIGPFYPIEAEKKGMTSGTVGIVFGLFEAVNFITAPFFGRYMVHLGPRFVLLAGIFVGGCCSILFGTLEYCPGGTPFIAMSVLLRFTEAIGVSGFLTSSFVIASCEFKDRIGFCLGVITTGSGMGFMLGPVIGGALHELGGFVLPFYSAGVAILLNGIAMYNYLPQTEDLPPKVKGSMLTLLASPMVSIAMCNIFITELSITSFETTLARHLELSNVKIGTIGLLFGIQALMYSITSPIWGYISDSKKAQVPLAIAGNFVFSVGFMLIGPSALLPFLEFDLATIVIGLTCVGAGFGCVIIPTMKCMVVGATELGFENNVETAALVSGLFHTIQSLGGFLGPIGCGYLVQEFDYPIVYTAIAMLNVLMMIVSTMLFTLRQRS